MLKQVETSKSVNRGVGASNVTGGGISQYRITTNSEIPSVYWEGRNVTPQSLTKLVRIEEKQNGVEGDHKSQYRKNSVILPSCKVELLMSQINVQEQKVTPLNSPRNSNNNKQGGTSTTNKEETISTNLNASHGIQIILTETRTITLLNVRSSVVAKDSRQYDTVMLQGREYEKLKASKLGSDRFASRSTQTPLTIQKDKEVMVMAVNKKDVACQSSTWDMIELTKCLEDAAGNCGDGSDIVCDKPQGGSYLLIHNKWPQHVPSKQSDDLIAMALTDIPGCFLDVSGTYAPPPIPQHSGDTRGTKRSSYYPNIGGVSRKGSTMSRSHWGGQSSTSVSRSARRSIAAADNNNTSFSVASCPRGGTATASHRSIAAADNNNPSFSAATNCPKGVTATPAASATLSAMRDPNRNELSLEEVVKRLFEKKTRSITESPELLSALQIVERCIASHSFHQKQLLYCYSPLLGSATALHGGGVVSDARNVFSSIRKM